MPTWNKALEQFYESITIRLRITNMEQAFLNYNYFLEFIVFLWNKNYWNSLLTPGSTYPTRKLLLAKIKKSSSNSLKLKLRD